MYWARYSFQNFCRVVRANQIGDNFFNLARPVALIAKPPHITFRQHPVPEPDATQQNLAAVLINNVFALRVKKSCRECGI